MSARKPASSRIIVVLIGDVVASRQVVDRRKLAEQVTRGMKSAGATFARHLLAPPAKTAGDSVVLALSVPDDGYNIAVLLDRTIWPQQFRWAMASGTVDVGLRSRIVGEMDGPAFHRAAGALHRAREENLPFALDLGDRSEASQRVVEWLIRLCADIRSSWTPAEARVAHLMNDARRQLDVARKLGISPQAVAQTLRRGRYQDLEVGARLISAWLMDEPRKRAAAELKSS